jgi:hypothetical protein
MSGLALFDTNILVYADDAAAPEKRERLGSEPVGRQSPLSVRWANAGLA